MRTKIAIDKASLQKRGKSTGFTLIEMLVVLVVLAILSVLALPTLRSTTESYGITGGLGLIADTLRGAQQLSISDNLPVQVRICKLNNSANYSWLLVCEVENDGTLKLGSPPRLLPTSVCVSSNAPFSSIMNLPVNAPTSTDPGLAAAGQQYTYVKITFLPSGGTDLSPTSNWFVTVVSTRSSAATTLPNNFATIQIDPVNGITTAFRP